MDFFQSQDVARRNTSLLVVYFVLAVATIVAAVYFLLLLLFQQANQLESLDVAPSLWMPELFLGVMVGTLSIILIGSLFKISQLSGGGHVVAESLGGRLLNGESQNLRERMLLNVVEEIAIASGTAVPPVFLLDEENGINAFAAGFSPDTAVIGVTKGCLDRLTRDQLQGVIAHEFSHILNGDMRLNIRLMGLVHGILVIALIGQIILRSMGRSSTRSSSSRKGKDNGGGAFIILAIGLMVIGYIGVFFGKLIKSAVSRQREFLADASAVQFTRNPQGIASALMTIGGYSRGSKIASPQAETASHMYFSNGLRSSLFTLMSTHPPLDERIRRIDPSFKGKFATSQILTDEESLGADAYRAQLAPASSMNLVGDYTLSPLPEIKKEERFAFAAKSSIEQVGQPQARHLEFASSLLTALPDFLRSAVHHPIGAQSTLYALLLSDDFATRQSQLSGLTARTTDATVQLTERLAAITVRLPTEYRIPLVELTLPALHQISETQCQTFRDVLTYLARADGQISLFEMGLLRIVIKALFGDKDRTTRRLRSIRKSVAQQESSILLSALARVGHADDATVQRAFSVGMKLLPFRPAPALVAAEECPLTRIWKSLDLLTQTPPKFKKLILEAAAETIGADSEITIDEAEMLRIVAHALECPMPPLIVGRVGG
ncbi:MAG: M48 family metallopeptidase [Planctomycetota bacterium]|nr:M48 family metallopeptidase [Planctomycetota bacterium]MDA1213280.1 M48 family metallopeptidase [Planctomycetota bacterium]